MQKIKAIISDFDGTLVNKEGKYSLKTKELIAKVQSLGVKFSIATGRLYSDEVRKIEEELNIKGVHIFHGGGKIYDTEKNKSLFLQPISSSSILDISKYLIENRVYFALETESEIFMSPEIKKVEYLRSVIVNRIDKYNWKDGVLKLLIFARLNFFKEEQLDFHIKNIQKISQDIEIIKFNFEGNFGVDITSEKATKHTAILEYCKLLGLKPENVVGIGDGYNDYHLFTASGFKIAMGNSPKELREIADLIVPTVDEGGMEKALEYILKNLT